MLDKTLRTRLDSLLDECLSEHRALEIEVLSSRSAGLNRLRQAERLSELLAFQFEEIDRLIGDDPALYRAAATGLREHPLDRDVFMQSAVLSQRRARDNGGVFGSAFHRMVFQRPDLGHSAYSQLLNEAVFDLPLCRAMRTLSDGIAGLIAQLPDGARVAGVHTGSAPEVLSLKPSRRKALAFELWDDDSVALAHLDHNVGREGVFLRRTEPFSLPEGLTGPYDLIYSTAGLARPLDDAVAGNPAAAYVRALFAQLASGGRLVLAAPLPPGGGNPHRPAHRMLLEPSESPQSMYRSPADLIALTTDLPDGAFQARLTMENVSSPIGRNCVFAVLTLTAM